MKKPGPARRLKKALRRVRRMQANLGAGKNAGKNAARKRSMLARLWARDGAMCWLCRGRINMGLSVAHRKCNGRRGHSTVEEFRQRWGTVG